jgi:cell pole-organizing protein PopZ
MALPTQNAVIAGTARGRKAAHALLRTLVLVLLLVPSGFAAQTRTNFDHDTTGFELRGQHRDLRCESCHANAIFKGTPRDCQDCHGVGTAIRATAKPTNHILSTNNCIACHAEIAWSPAVNFDHTQARGSCSTCHNGVQAQGKGPTHIVTDLECDACHTTLTWAGAMFTHQGVTNGCAACHNNVQALGMPPTHIPIGTVPCEGCHSPTNFITFAGTKINHLSVTSLTCQSCHETAAYLGMHPSTNTTAADSRPSATLDKAHPVSGDCGQCHDTTTFANSALRPANHIPTNAPCSQCHTTAGNYAAYSVTGVHQGVTSCLSCHGATLTFANITTVGKPANHMPIGTLDCNGSGCHTTTNVNPGGFRLGAANISAPTLGIAGHNTIASVVPACQTCHETAPYVGMLASTATSTGDSRPTAFDKGHPTSGDCSGCHTSTPTFATNITQSAKPANHIPTTAACTQCHTTAGNYAVYSVTATHQGVTGCLSCHGATLTFANITTVGTPANHMPIGSLDCNGSGCHTTTDVNPGGFKLGNASISTPTLSVAGHGTVSAAVPTCATCHESAPYAGMLVSTATTAADSRPTAFDSKHPSSGDCGNCHVTTPTFATNLLPTATKPANHIPTTAVCAQCHTTAGSFAVYSVSGVHQGLTSCLSCHGSTVGPFLNVTMVTTPANHIPIGTLDCSGSGCHTTKNVNPGGFRLGSASISAPTLNVAGHTTVAAAVSGCQSCHETAPYLGMLPSSATAAGDSRPTALDKSHPTSGDCSGCHTSTPTFATNITPSAKPANHIPTTAACAQCHTTAGNYAAYSVTGTHQGVTSCLSCHGATLAFANITTVGKPANHMPIGTLDCNGSGCHSTTNVNPGGFKLGNASISTPTLNVAGHGTVSAAVPACATCHESAPYAGMLVSTATAAADSRPTAFDSKHPTSGDCGNCHVTTPTFATNLLPTATKPANHIPTTAVCAQCHTTAGNFAVYSVSGVHQGVTSCLSCHAPKVGPFLNVTMVTTPANHIPIGTLDCNGSGCHSTTNVNPGGFRLGAANISAPTLSIAGHSTVAGAVPACQTCHETAPYVGMLASTATSAGDSRPTAFDKNHPTSGDCTGCHTSTPTFATNVTQTGKPANHIPTTAACTQCHTTAGNYAAYSVTATHQGVTGCLSCHGATLAFANITTVGKPANHMPIGTLDCNGSGCHTTTDVNAGGFKLGTANINAPTLGIAGHNTIAGVVPACQTCHETAPYVGMLASTATSAGDSRPTAFDKNHPTSGDCTGCHTSTPTFATNVTQTGKPANHIPTTAACTQCHTTAGNYAAYSVTATHQGVTGCLSCHGATLAFANITTVGKPANHMPIGTLDCNGSGCHTTTNVNPGGFKLGNASIATPTLTVAGHATVSAAVPACATCHESAPYAGMLVSSATAAADSRPTAFDSKHPTSGDCGNCHVTTPTFATNLLPTATKPANHIPTTAVCAQCHTTAGNFAVYSVSGVHQGVTSCLSCHGSTVGPFLNVTMVTTPANHMPIGTLDCSGSGCHTTKNVNPGGFKIGAASISAPTLTVAGHTTVAAAVSGCQTCHETAPYVGMLVSSATVAGDSRPTALDKAHPTSGDCNGCHTTTPTFATDQTGNAKPANHIPTTAACTQCHTTAGNYAAYSVTATHQGVTGCLSCHGATLAFANITTVGKPANHMPIGTLDCNGSGCHKTTNVNPGGFKIGAASLSAPTLTVAGHTTVAAAVSGCQTCHETAPYVGMLPSSATAAGDSRPTAFDKAHPTTGDCNGCHTTTPTFTSNVTAGSKPTNHIPTSAACTQCHTTAGNYAAYVMGATGHKGIASNCAQCHAYGLSFYNMAPPTLVQPPSGSTGHIPAVPPNGTATIACELCHSPAAFTTFSGTVMKHAYVTALKCMSCHEFGMAWKTNSGVRLWTRPSANHHAGQDCNGSGCHSSRDKFAARPVGRATTTGGGSTASGNSIPGARSGASESPRVSAAAPGEPAVAGPFVHPPKGVAACVSCHSGAGARPATHIATTDRCEHCHSTIAWLPVVGVDHTQVRGTCSTCHNGVTATGKPAKHLATAAACERCHTTNAWIPARVDHAGIAAHTCATCHNSVRAIGMPRTHVPTTQPCDTCHGTLGWRPARVDHSHLSAACSSCHNNRAAVGIPPGHLNLRSDCGSCHAYPDWSVVHFRHSGSAYPGNHRAEIGCSTCHTGNTEAVPYPSPANAGTCAGCHARNFTPAAHPKDTKGLSYTVSELANCSGACHVYTDATQASIAKRLPGPHHRVSDATFKH